MLVNTLKTRLVFIFLSTWKESVHWGEIVPFSFFCGLVMYLLAHLSLHSGILHKLISCNSTSTESYGIES